VSHFFKLDLAGFGRSCSANVIALPVILQDRRFNADGTFFHRFNEIAAVAAGYVGDTKLANSSEGPVAATAPGERFA